VDTHSTSEYALGKRETGVPMPEGLKENDKFPNRYNYADNQS
jgi:hypothetical protein